MPEDAPLPEKKLLSKRSFDLFFRGTVESWVLGMGVGGDIMKCCCWLSVLPLRSQGHFFLRFRCTKCNRPASLSAQKGEHAHAFTHIVCTLYTLSPPLSLTSSLYPSACNFLCSQGRPLNVKLTHVRPHDFGSSAGAAAPSDGPDLGESEVLLLPSRTHPPHTHMRTMPRANTCWRTSAPEKRQRIPPRGPENRRSSPTKSRSVRENLSAGVRVWSV